ncbi:hypothetical protein CYL18_06825 [Pradoshia eiseniae]|uniref:Histidine kinase n=1 Tax=Pradoshia eiseniae TaxID=2064768 RepID=A0A2S7N0R6_9BACI|nr:hypothetical protein [Pradoshia eiseniae]PQD95603.1 hypothetical protein CYL18_06825 [Pradoshia eiseniae]
MNLVKFFGLQFLLFGVVLLTNFYLDSYISKPFTFTDFIAIIIGLLIIIPVFILYGKLDKRLKPIPIFIVILLIILAMVFASIFTAFMTGEVQF